LELSAWVHDLFLDDESVLHQDFLVDNFWAVVDPVHTEIVQEYQAHFFQDCFAGGISFFI